RVIRVIRGQNSSPPASNLVYCSAEPIASLRLSSPTEFFAAGEQLRLLQKEERPLSNLQSQRDCVLQPRVASRELPWVSVRAVFNPNDCALSLPAEEIRIDPNNGTGD
ncbi:MAG: hypothetical protein WCQ21_18470, partial [Verrucomicrobiota bacterium]